MSPPKQGRKGLAVLTIGLLLWLAAGIPLVLAQSPPPLPAAYWGSLTVAGQAAPPGTAVCGYIEGAPRGCIIAQRAQQYGGARGDQAKLIIRGADADIGKVIRFTLTPPGTLSGEAQQTATYVPGDVLQLDLSLTQQPAAAPTAVPSPAPTPDIGPTAVPAPAATATATPTPPSPAPSLGEPSPPSTATPSPTFTPTSDSTPTSAPVPSPTATPVPTGTPLAVIMPTATPSPAMATRAIVTDARGVVRQVVSHASSDGLAAAVILPGTVAIGADKLPVAAITIQVSGPGAAGP